MRFIANILLILIICYSVSAIPINTSFVKVPTFSNIFSAAFKEDPEMPISYTYKTNFTNDLVIDPTSIDFTMTGNFDKGSYVLSENHQIILEVSQDGESIGEYYDNEIVTSLNEVSDDNLELAYTLDISQENLELNDGTYDFKIYSSLEAFNEVEPYVFSVQYGDSNVINKDMKYIASKNDVERGFMYLTLYFPDKDYNYLVPVSRKVPYSNEIIRTTIENLRKGPSDSLGLNEGSPIPDAPVVWVKQGVASIHLPSDIGIYDQGSAISQFAIESFVNSLTSIYGVEKVEFLKNGKYVDTLFHGTDVSRPFEPDNYPSAYLAFGAENERILLAPLDIYDSKESVEDMAALIFASLKTGNVNDLSYDNLYPTIPRSVELINSNYSNGLLTLNLSKEFISSYDTRDDLKSMMLDSILYSFISIPKVNKISLLIEDEVVSNFAGINISEPMATPEYINIENPK